MEYHFVRPTLQEVADDLGLSLATVWRAMWGHVPSCSVIRRRDGKLMPFFEDRIGAVLPTVIHPQFTSGQWR